MPSLFISTSAKPDEIERVFSEHKTIDIGKRYGTIAVVLDGKPYEITTYREDKDAVVAAFADLYAKGVYQKELYAK